jgi:hypothetical protein
MELLPGHLLPVWEVTTLTAGLQGPQSVRHTPGTISSHYYLCLVLSTYLLTSTFIPLTFTFTFTLRSAAFLVLQKRAANAYN